MKLLTSELIPPDLEALQNKFLSFLFFQLLFFQKDHSAFKQLEPGTGLGVEASEDFFFQKGYKVGYNEREVRNHNKILISGN